MKIECPTPARIPGLRRLWQEAFGDSPEFLDKFFGTAFDPRRCRCVTQDDEIAAALYWFHVSCQGQPMAYLYGVATGKAYRNRGLCRALMADTRSHLQSLGYKGILLVPEGDNLRRMYGGLGYENCTTVQEFSCTAGAEPVRLQEIDGAEYARLRRELLPQGAVIQEGENLAFLGTYARFYSGEGFLATLYPEEDALLGLELLGDPGAAPGILKALSAGHGTFRTPGEGREFAMFLPLDENAPRPGYFAFAFD